MADRDTYKEMVEDQMHRQGEAVKAIRSVIERHMDEDLGISVEALIDRVLQRKKIYHLVITTEGGTDGTTSVKPDDIVQMVRFDKPEDRQKLIDEMKRSKIGDILGADGCSEIYVMAESAPDFKPPVAKL